MIIALPAQICLTRCTEKGHRKKEHRKKGHGKKGTGKMGTGKKGTSEKLGKKRTKGKKKFICRLLLLLFNQHLDYSMYIYCGCLLFVFTIACKFYCAKLN